MNDNDITRSGILIVCNCTDKRARVTCGMAHLTYPYLPGPEQMLEKGGEFDVGISP